MQMSIQKGRAPYTTKCQQSRGERWKMEMKENAGDSGVSQGKPGWGWLGLGQMFGWGIKCQSQKESPRSKHVSRESWVKLEWASGRNIDSQVFQCSHWGKDGKDNSMMLCRVTLTSYIQVRWDTPPSTAPARPLLYYRKFIVQVFWNGVICIISMLPTVDGNKNTVYTETHTDLFVLFYVLKIHSSTSVHSSAAGLAALLASLNWGCADHCRL